MAENQAAATNQPPPVLQHVPFPTKLDLPDDPSARKVAWESFKQVWENYEISSLLSEHPSTRRTATLLTCFSASALKLYNSLDFTDAAQKTNIQVVLEKMTTACKGIINPTYERYLFNTRCQKPDESVDTYFSSLLELSKTCDFGDLCSSLIRDRLVVGLKDASVRKKLLSETNLTLERCLQISRSYEATQSQISSMASADIDAVQRQKKKKYPKSKKTSSFEKKDTSAKKCNYCNGSLHQRNECPARNASCNKCHIRGHFAVACRKTVRNTHHTDEVQEEFFLDSISNNDSGAWFKDVMVDSTPLAFKIDTGADVSILPYTAYQRYFSSKVLFPVTSILRVPGGSKLEILGRMKCRLSYKDVTINSELFVTKSSTALLSRTDSVNMGIVALIDSVDQYPDLFKGLGTMPDTYHITLKDDATPFAINAPRRISLPLFPKVEAELTRLEKLNVIRKVDEPTDWCAPIVPVLKSNGQVRLCVDYKNLNESVKRELHMLPSVDQILGQVGKASVFSKLDANSGFHQILLDEESQLLTTFMTPKGRYCYLRLPFGISSAPEHYQKQMQKILAGLDGIVCLMDDIVVYGKTKAEHDERLDKCLQRLAKAGVTLNKDKCKFHQTEIEFLGHIVGKSGIKADPKKIAAILELEEPRDIKSLRSFLGMVNQLGKFLPDLATVTEPLRQLLSPKAIWIWDFAQKSAFLKVKEMLTSTPILIPYDYKRPTKISADSSSYGLGAVLLQLHDDIWKPVAFASRSLSDTEKRYAQVEKEALAALWACTKFQDYIYGIHFSLETDHKPLVALFGSKTLDAIPPRIQRMRMRMMRYSYDIHHVAGKDMHTADTLSRAPMHSTISLEDKELENDVSCHISEVLRALPIRDTRIEKVRLHQLEDPTCRLLMTYIEEGWPSKDHLSGTIGLYWTHRMHLTLEENTILYNNRLLIPGSLRHYILDQLHIGHQGITKCRMRAQQSVWWPGINRDIEDLIKCCKECAKQQTNRPEPLVPTPTPDYPWQKVASDLFEYEKRNYLLMVDYYSRFIEVIELTKITSSEIIAEMKRIFSRNGIPECLISDNGRQYVSEEFKVFTNNWGISHVTSSPGHPSANGLAERTVRTVKELWKPSNDFYSAILAYHSTPLACGYSPAELFFSRIIRSHVPSIQKRLSPEQPNFRARDEKNKVTMMLNFDKKASSSPLSILPAGQEVWVKDRAQEGTVVEQLTPRSYSVRTPTGTYRRNRRILNELPTNIDKNADQTKNTNMDNTVSSRSDKMINTTMDNTVSTRSGRIIKPPIKLNL